MYRDERKEDKDKRKMKERTEVLDEFWIQLNAELTALSSNPINTVSALFVAILSLMSIQQVHLILKP